MSIDKETKDRKLIMDSGGGDQGIYNDFIE